MSSQIIEKLIEDASRVLANSYSPYSGIRVAAAVRTRSGSTYLGVNVENSSYSLTICAERVAIFNAITHGDKEIEWIAIVTDLEDPIPPCGACRQVIAEFNPSANIVMYSVKSKKIQVTTLQRLLPMSFKLPKR